MIKMDAIILLGAIGLAYGGMLLIYYRSNLKEKEKRTSTLMFNGVMNLRRGNLDKALVYFNRFYENSIEKDDYEEMAEAMYHIGLVYKEKGKNKKAMRYFNGANELYGQLEDKEGFEKTTNTIRSITDN